MRTYNVTPAQAGISRHRTCARKRETPACAGVTFGQGR
jgi:hypothetical protein